MKTAAHTWAKGTRVAPSDGCGTGSARCITPPGRCCIRCTFSAHLSGTFAAHLSVTMAKQGRYANDLEHGRGKRLYPSGDTFEVHHSHAAAPAPIWAPLSVCYCVCRVISGMESKPVSVDIPGLTTIATTPGRSRVSSETLMVSEPPCGQVAASTLGGSDRGRSTGGDAAFGPTAPFRKAYGATASVTDRTCTSIPAVAWYIVITVTALSGATVFTNGPVEERLLFHIRLMRLRPTLWRPMRLLPTLILRHPMPTLWCPTQRAQSHSHHHPAALFFGNIRAAAGVKSDRGGESV